ncbi:pca operon transcription factor PcaQ [Candidimonas sp. SYP-B2681]|uniref:pca operon transcription factor PcaQ n=1 Tax=Candidimonas sp. SYP-B2681 TaxID=2497686 RepID=UPI000F88D8ED|nr:pca operon transcription factor PcaQ [Candidimonas sp. SYP-B2681]RTZ48027.1 pca operon transcription factor PcaQ [Candidimonas sp. SYP-B2681]
MQYIFAAGRLKLRHLQCFLAVSQTKSVQRAADSLSITQPAVSKTLSELESILGFRLFERGRHGAALTEEGLAFAPYAQTCLVTLREGITMLRERGMAIPAKVAIGILPTVAAVLLPVAIKTFRETSSTTSVRILTGANRELLELLKSGEADFIVGRLAEPEAMMGLSFEHLYREPLAVVVRADHPLTREERLSPAALSAYPLVVPPLGTLIRQSAESVITAFGLKPEIVRFETVSVSMGRALALQNEAVWFVPSSAVEEDVARGVLESLQMPFAGTDEPIGLIRRNDVGLNPVTAKLIDCVRNTGLERERLRTQ